MTDFAVAGRTTAEYIRGALYGLAAVSIWSGWIVVARLGLKTSLTPWDIAALRFGVAGLLLLPYVVSKGLALKRLGWLGLAVAAPVLVCAGVMLLVGLSLKRRLGGLTGDVYGAAIELGELAFLLAVS